MVVNIQAIKFNASDKLEAYVQKKVAKLEKLCSENSSVDVFMKLIKPETAENKEVERTSKYVNLGVNSAFDVGDIAFK